MKESAAQVQLCISEGVLLAHALVARIADNLGVRVFFIKGPASVLQGLRRPKVSTDVDVFVDPASLTAILQGLRERGWRERPKDLDSKCYPEHAATLDHPDWPCCVDVHFRIPGMEKPPIEYFEVMWAQTHNIDLAGQALRVPSMASAILVLALHALRSPSFPASQQDLNVLRLLTQGQSLPPSILEIARATGALAAIRPFLEDLLSEAAVGQWPLPSKEWSNRLIAREPGTARILALLQASWRDKLHMVWRAVFPPKEAILSANPYADLSLRGRLGHQRSQWGRFVRSAPGIFCDVGSGILVNRGTCKPQSN